ncbi:MAG: NUDIX domain-containing protein [Chloroflexota bacterium]
MLRPSCPECGWVYYAKPAMGAAVFVERDDSVLLVQRAHEPFLGGWMLPAGFVEYGEFAQDTAIREALEETGLMVELTGLFGLYFGTDDPRNVAHLAVYRAVVRGGELRAGDDAADAGFFRHNQLPVNIAFMAHQSALADWRDERSTGSSVRSSARLTRHPKLH